VLANYLKLAWKVLQRRKFFTFVSLFGIGVTLAVLLVATAILDHVFAPHPPETRMARTLGVYAIALEGDHARRTGFPGYAFLDRYVRNLPGAERTTFFTVQQTAVSYVGGRKISSWLKRTDGEFWKVLDFRFVEGAPFTDADEANRSFVAVINEATRDRFFGAGAAQAGVVGRRIEVDGQSFRVVGVVENVPFLRFAPFADVWVPISTRKSSGYLHEISGDFQALILGRNRAALPGIRAELAARVRRAQLPDPKEFHTVRAGAETLFEAFSRAFFSNGFQAAHPGRLRAFLLAAMVLFMLLPAVNLVNVNLSRIMERSSEIGVRKAFGGSSWSLVGQFLVENVVLTLVGGAVGLVLSVLVLHAIDASGVIPYARLSIDFRVFLESLGIALFFGVLSGVYPAWKMARLHPVEALHGRFA